ncbi:MAG: hypothetical protein HY738_06750 [Bacteroidia bacterium]|nr:hypothetical protein [Bacteroidia bacterium]
MKKSACLFLVALSIVALSACKTSTKPENQEGDSLSVENIVNTLDEGLVTDTGKTDTVKVK